MIVGAEENAGRIGEAGRHSGQAGPCRQKTLALHRVGGVRPIFGAGEVAHDAVQGDAAEGAFVFDQLVEFRCRQAEAPMPVSTCRIAASRCPVLRRGFAGRRPAAGC